MLMNTFLSLSHVLTTARPSSQYNLTFFPNLCYNEFRMKSPEFANFCTVKASHCNIKSVVSVAFGLHAVFVEEE